MEDSCFHDSSPPGYRNRTACRGQKPGLGKVHMCKTPPTGSLTRSKPWKYWRRRAPGFLSGVKNEAWCLLTSGHAPWKPDENLNPSHPEPTKLLSLPRRACSLGVPGQQGEAADSSVETAWTARSRYCRCRVAETLERTTKALGVS